MKEMLLLCTKDVHFLFEDDIYQQTDGIAMGSSLGPILAGISIVELETTIVPTLGNLLRKWKRYKDDTYCIVKTDSANENLLKLNSFHINIQFTYEAESNNLLPFLDVLLISKNSSIETIVYRKQPTNNDIYLNWNLFSSKSWKRGTLRTIIKRAYAICSTKDLLQKELDNILFVFQNYTNFPKWVIDQVLHQENENHRVIRSVQPEMNDVNDEKSHLLVLPHAGQKREKLIKSLKTTLKNNLPNNIVTKSAYSASKLSNKFNIKSKTKTRSST